MKTSERRRFDRLLEQVLAEIPPRVHRLLDEAPLVVEDRPSRALLEQFRLDDEPGDLCGLHTGTPLTERSVNDALDLPEMIYLFREGIIDEAGGWDVWEDDEGQRWGGEAAVKKEIRVTLLHEIGHHFGLEENDLEDLGYG